MKEQGYNYQHQLFVEAIDIDETCFKMAYIQFSILGILARVMLGDTLAWKFQKVLYTPFYFVNGFEYKLEQFNKFVKDLNDALMFCQRIKVQPKFSGLDTGSSWIQFVIDSYPLVLFIFSIFFKSLIGCTNSIANTSKMQL